MYLETTLTPMAREMEEAPYYQEYLALLPCKADLVTDCLCLRCRRTQAPWLGVESSHVKSNELEEGI